MKRVGGLYDTMFSIDALYEAYLDARRGKRSKRACFEFEQHLFGHLEELQRELAGGTYKPRAYYRFIVHEPKERIIHAPAFRDTVVQHAIYRVIYPIFNRTFVDTSFACRVGKGTHAAADYTQRALRACDPESYVLKLDIRKFFYRIDRAVLCGLVERKIKDRRLVDLMMLFADHEEPTGIPIGNLLSQIYALIYLNPLDHYVKRRLRVRWYCRYVDDFVLFGLSRAECLEYRARIVAFLCDELRLGLSKSSISKVKRGVNFVGYRTWPTHRLIRKHSLFKFRRAVKARRLESIVSLLGHAQRTDSLQHMLNYILDTDHALFNSLPKSLRCLYRPHAGRAGLRRG